jgi:hypothetical protein
MSGSCSPFLVRPVEIKAAKTGVRPLATSSGPEYSSQLSYQGYQGGQGVAAQNYFSSQHQAANYTSAAMAVTNAAR